MTVTVPPAQSAGLSSSPPRRRRTGRGRGRRTGVRRVARQALLTAELTALVGVAAVGIVTVPGWVPPAVLIFVLLLGVFVLQVSGMLVVSAASLIALILLMPTNTGIVPGSLVLQVLAAVAALAFVSRRDRLGLNGAASDFMLVDLRDRLVAHGRIPPLPARWRVDSIVRSAYAEAFSGDFVVAARSQGGRLLEIVLVDVSGKGQEAGVRSLLLSGAFGGLLGAMPREEFLPAANRYLLQQDWPEGFATAVHLVIRLETGEYWVSTAGHPPAVHLHSGSGMVELVHTFGGPALGVVASPTFAVHGGVMAPGDTLMLYTDGLIESPGADVDLGIDRLMGEAERVIFTRSGGADAVVAGVRAGEGDDRALILVHHD